MRIIGPPSATRDAVRANLAQMPGQHSRFAGEMFLPLWMAAERYTVDPVGVVAQAYKETGGGQFGGKVKPEHYNTAGIKVRHQNAYPETTGDLPLAHAMFASWEVGATAHVQHLRAYAGWPVEDLIVDPRYWFVVHKHRLENFEDLSGKWAPAADYGERIEAIARQLRGI